MAGLLRNNSRQSTPLYVTLRANGRMPRWLFSSKSFFPISTNLPNSAISSQVCCRREPLRELTMTSMPLWLVAIEMPSRNSAVRTKHLVKQLFQAQQKSPSPQVCEIDTIRVEERMDLWALNATLPAAIDVCVHDIVAEKVEQQPDSAAISSWDGDLTYHELGVLSDKLAYILLDAGVRLEVIVPLLFEKSMWSAVAALAVMKAGGASLMLDPAQSAERLSAIVQQARPILILSSSSAQEKATHLASTPVITVDTELLAGLVSTTQSLPVVNPDSAVYCVFTSGSSGVPKGVVCTHSNISSALHHQAEAINQASWVLDLSSYAFDIAWYNLLHTLFAGGCLCIPREHDRIHNISEAVTKSNANFVNVTPTVAEMLDVAALQSLSAIELIGERASQELLLRLKANVGSVRNTFGPTECTSMICVSTDFRDPSHIGKGRGANTWVVDTETLDLAPRFGIGELWVEGPLVSRGYLHDAEKTAASFVDNPSFLLKGVPGRLAGRSGRLYRTGDMVRDDSDGSLIYLGRRDGQVKINGQRIELGEVEHHVRLTLDEDTRVAAEVVMPLDRKRPT